MDETETGRTARDVEIETERAETERPACEYHRAASNCGPLKVSRRLWAFLVLRWAGRKCLECRRMRAASEMDGTRAARPARAARPVQTAPHGPQVSTMDAGAFLAFLTRGRDTGRPAIRCKGWKPNETGHGTVILSIGRGTRAVSDTLCGPCERFMLSTMRDV